MKIETPKKAAPAATPNKMTAEMAKQLGVDPAAYGIKAAK